MYKLFGSQQIRTLFVLCVLNFVPSCWSARLKSEHLQVAQANYVSSHSLSLRTKSSPAQTNAAPKKKKPTAKNPMNPKEYLKSIEVVMHETFRQTDAWRSSTVPTQAKMEASEIGSKCPKPANINQKLGTLLRSTAGAELFELVESPGGGDLIVKTKSLVEPPDDDTRRAALKERGIRILGGKSFTHGVGLVETLWFNVDGTYRSSITDLDVGMEGGSSGGKYSVGDDGLTFILDGKVEGKYDPLTSTITVSGKVYK